MRGDRLLFLRFVFSTVAFQKNSQIILDDPAYLLKKKPTEIRKIDRVGTNKDDMHVNPSVRGHGKQMIILKAPTFCAKDMGVSFDPHSYSYSCSS
jgi:hypothetical protein